MNEINAGVMLLRPWNGKHMIAGVGRSPVIIPVGIDETCQEAVHVTRRLQEELGGRLFLRQVIDVSSPERERRLFVAEAQDGSFPERRWLPADEHRADVTNSLRSALIGEENLDRFHESVVEEIIEAPDLPWCRPGWFNALQSRIEAHFSVSTDIQPYKLRLGRIVLRAANSHGMYEIHAASPNGMAGWASDPLYDAEARGLLQGWRPALIASFPELGAELREAPLGASLVTLGDLSHWSTAMKSMAELQFRSSMNMNAASASADLSSRFRTCMQEWQAQEIFARGFGARSLEWIQDCVSDAGEVLDESALPQVLVNGAMSGFTTYIAGSQIQISEWEPTYVGHPFTTLARPLSHRAGALGEHQQAILARPFVGAWLRYCRPADLSKEVRAGIVVGSAVQATAAWERGRSFTVSATPALGPQIAGWCETILRRAAG
ncbi:hypothetical protein AB0L28_34280 [Streptomyces sp. NPDC052503]|uniref:hypothetical protein n=1 Tax=Streptomyces sp. NPDC052503 TaxID=3156683 RepID=UPI00136B4AFD|nr:hypothetical protein [Streptomyces sp. SID7834]MYT56038.1 hypothetical protein [Streptomyces sp. SID7834]MYT60730.1 hypothetical protein [Streptomyces sp. SID7834]